ETVLARVLITVYTRPGEIPDYSVAEIENQLRETMQSWEDRLSYELLEQVGEESGNQLFNLYGNAFPAGYREDFSARTGVRDILRLERLSDGHPLEMHLYRPLEDPQGRLSFKVFGRNQAMPLSDALPILERLGLSVLAARPYELELSDGRRLWILDFDMREEPGIAVEVGAVREHFQEAFARIWSGQMENDGFNRLVVAAALPWRDVTLLRAYCKYLLQTRVPFSQPYMEQAVGNHPQIAAQLVELFHARFNPRLAQGDSGRRTTELGVAIEEALDQVSNLDEDRILRRFLAAILATLRTNFYQKGEDGPIREYVSFKFDPARIPEMPLPLPMFEIFVYSPRTEAVHLRGGPVARGGLRWSDRREDFRTEVLGLMKAQMVKNAVIVPVGSKGGFVVKRPPVTGGREALQQEVEYCYTTFISGMLDITDNLVAGEVVPPRDVVRYDNDDPYLVVAADKGTATFSDLANSIAIRYGFWLGDAFASGGSAGYDHKKMGITARGAWESVKRHFRELGKDIQNEDFTVVGIGDMGGDVFGNGMLLSRHIRLLAAFNHLHIFIDPNPDAQSSYQERERLFRLPRSTWEDYDKSLISQGGGIYSRSAKSIQLSPQAREALGIRSERLTPNELVHNLLKAPVELLWNGGIGTYVKAVTETHGDAGDRANDAVRVNGVDLRCKVVGEGGNLGCTQLGRIEYARKGGHIYTDAIDNSGGVDSSDHEVNIKILLNQVVDSGDMTVKQRNQLLAEMTDEVAQLVLRHNYLQTQAISATVSRSPQMLGEHIRVIRRLERMGRLNREIEYLPSDEQLAEREAAHEGLTRPELAVLLAYSKIVLFEALVNSDVPDDPYLQRELINYFPSRLSPQFHGAMETHRLRKEIIATYITNSMLNRMGSVFTFKLQEAGETAPDIARAYAAAREIYQARKLWAAIEDLDCRVAASVQIDMNFASRHLIERATLWLLRNRRPPLDISMVVGQFKDDIQTLAGSLAGLLSGSEAMVLETQARQLTEAGVPEELAQWVASLDNLYPGLDIIEVASGAQDLGVQEVARIYFGLVDRLRLSWLRSSIAGLPVSNHWQNQARAALLNNLYEQQRALTAAVLRLSSPEQSPEQRLDNWLEHNRGVVERTLALFTDLEGSGQPDLAMLSVALRETGALVQGA
ncbi:MAG: NAD-glutamate dehydrogenase, partial [Candidatus Competibacteraceae bacterium]|nr:NAD-glutamate dehydrogenase [Candidatus Competibacteraceae bacterium]